MKILPIRWFRSKKNRRKNLKKNVFKTNVSSQKIRMRKEEGATVGVCRPFCSLPSLSGLTRLSFVGPFKAVQRKSKPLGNTHKIPFISDYRVVASTSFQNSTDWPSKTEETNTKNADESENRLKT